MLMQKPVVEYVPIDMKDMIMTSGECSSCSQDGGYTGGGQICFGDMGVSTQCTDAMSIALEG